MRLATIMASLLMLSAALSAAPVSDAVRNDITAWAAEFQSALAKHDQPAIRAMLDQHFRLTTIEGTVLNRSQFVDAVKERHSETTDYKVQFSVSDLQQMGDSVAGQVSEVSTTVVNLPGGKSNGLRSQSKYHTVWHKAGKKWLVNSFQQTGYSMDVNAKPVVAEGKPLANRGVLPNVYLVRCTGKRTVGTRTEGVVTVAVAFFHDGAFSITSAGEGNVEHPEIKGTWKAVSDTKADLTMKPEADGKGSEGKGEVVVGRDGFPRSVRLESKAQGTGEITRLEVSAIE